MLEILNKMIEMSIQASFVIVVIVIARFLLLKLNAPKRMIQLLWLIPVFRLVCPISIAAGFSIVPVVERTTNPTSNTIDMDTNLPFAGDINSSHTLSIWEKPQGDTLLGNTSNIAGAGIENTTEHITNIVSMQELSIHIFMLVWLIGFICLIVYSLITTLRLRKKLVGSIYIEKNYYRADHIETPFVFGIVKPKIYLPTFIPEEEMQMVLLHEEMHIRRKDHIIKLLVFCITCIYWFNPFVWIMYVLFCRDMESAVDESVVSKFDFHTRQTYATCLLNMSTQRRHLIVSPLAFGEGDVKGRIKHIVNYKKAGRVLIVVVLIIILGLAAGLVTTRENQTEYPSGDSSPNQVSFIEFSPEMFPDDPEAKDGYRITTDVQTFPRTAFSPEIIELVKEDWKDADENIYSSHLRGMCYNSFDSWYDAETFIGKRIENPLATCGWLLPADAGTGMSLEDANPYDFAYPERYHCESTVWGDRAGMLQFVALSAGYQLDDLRITMSAYCYGDQAEESVHGMSYILANDVDFEVFETTLNNGSNAIIVFEPQIGNYVDANIYLAMNNVFYNIHVVGDASQELEVRHTAIDILNLFGAETSVPVKENLVFDAFVDRSTLPSINKNLPGYEVFEDREFVVSDIAEYEVEKLVYDWYLYTMMPDYSKKIALLNGNEGLIVTTRNEEKAFHEGKYYSIIHIYELNTFSTIHLNEISESGLSEISSRVEEHQLTEWTVVETDLYFTYSPVWSAEDPQLDYGRYQRYFLLGKTHPNDDWKIYDLYWGEYFIKPEVN